MPAATWCGHGLGAPRDPDWFRNLREGADVLGGRSRVAVLEPILSAGQ